MRFPPPVFHRRRRRWRRYGEWKASCKWIGPETRVAVRYTHTRTDSCGTDMKRPKHATKFMRSFNESQTEDWKACVGRGGCVQQTQHNNTSRGISIGQSQHGCLMALTPPQNGDQHCVAPETGFRCKLPRRPAAASCWSPGAIATTIGGHSPGLVWFRLWFWFRGVAWRSVARFWAGAEAATSSQQGQKW